MHKKMNLVLLGILSFIVTTNSVMADDLCYKANKNDFIHSPDTPYDVIFDLRDLKKKNWIYLSYSSLLPIPYADSTYGFYCIQDKKSSNSYACSGDCDGGRMNIRIENGYLEVQVKHARMTNTPDDPIMHDIESKEKTFTSADSTVCPKAHNLKSKREKHLPFVCYTWKHKEDVEGSNKMVYMGCTRHNNTCKSLEAKHFGKYPNDHESYKAYLRCEDANPNLVPDTSSSVVPPDFVKSKRKKEELLFSINIEDVTIYDLDYYEDLVIAVGEDDSEETNKLQSMDEYHESVMIRSTDGGKSWSRLKEGEEDSVPHDAVIVLDNKRIIVASSMEGSGGSIILSEDAGKTWETRFNNAFIESMTRLEGDTIVAKTFGPTIKSIDGGRNWVDIKRD